MDVIFTVENSINVPTSAFDRPIADSPHFVVNKLRPLTSLIFLPLHQSLCIVAALIVQTAVPISCGQPAVGIFVGSACDQSKRATLTITDVDRLVDFLA